MKLKGVRSKIKDEDILRSISKEELDWLRSRREYLDLDKINPLRAKVMLQCDQGRLTRDSAKLTVEEKLIQIEDLQVSTIRKVEELNSGNITTEIKDGVKMTVNELKVLIKREERMAKAISKDVIQYLNQLAAWTGQIDIAKNIIFTDEDFNAYVKNVETELSNMGYELFDI